MDPIKKPVSQQRAHEIIGRNFLGVEEAEQHYGVHFTEEQLRTLAEIPYTEEVLEACKDTHMLVAGFPLSLLDIRAKTLKDPRIFYTYEEDAWYDNPTIATSEKVNACWYLMRKNAVPNSALKTFAEQQRLISEYEEIPRACELVYAVMLYYLATNDRLFPNVYARCADLDSDGSRVYVGYFDSWGLRINCYRSDGRYDFVGLSSVQKPR